MNENDVLRMISELRSNAAIAKSLPQQQVQASEGTPGFVDTLQKAIDSVNATQKNAGALKKAFETGDPNVDLPQVMVASQKAKVAFDAMLEVRTKLLEAYKEISQMQV